MRRGKTRTVPRKGEPKEAACQKKKKKGKQSGKEIKNPIGINNNKIQYFSRSEGGGPSGRKQGRVP